MMLKRGLILMIFCFSIAVGQDDTGLNDDPMYQLLTKYRVNECADFISNAKILIPDYYNDNKLDSINMIIDYIDGHCSDSPFSVLENLLMIDSGDFPEDWCDSVVIDQMLRVPPYGPYMDRFMSSYGGWRIDGLGRFTNDSHYYDFLTSLASNLASRTDSSTIQHLVCRYYDGDLDYPIDRLHLNDFTGYCIQNRFDRRVDYLKAELRSWRGHWQIQSGVWVLQGNSQLFGEKLELGGSYGLRNKSWGTDLTCLMRTLKSENKYFVEMHDTLAETDSFFGLMLGADITREVFHFNRFEFESFTGIAYDILNTINTKDDKDGKDGKSIGAFSFNFGINTRIFCNKTRDYYLGMKLRYNIINYNNKGGTDLSGNSFSLCLTFGALGNKRIIKQAKILKMYD
ncbi:MAG: hypothetical protein GY839_11075 [candidate division Zixibacteria bacterium]|nr:hypothetical protein [candidate division Zixibacteria bacterium]